ncbi:hypothetical protein Micbo1qcDRAFT_181347 [Microdochium bolleyi]|uniref:Helicase C-terminal domain-containing protein n=1 Tax=Microdochium bolleyi TaxID=196109 RepID=A0A136IIL1_9PEZI|nr:hypothetical protein Micbo1qcDRAFT_181347 [Microdochium bolleyi]
MAIRYEADAGCTGGQVGLLSWPAADASSSQEHRVLLCVSCRVGIRPNDGIRLHFWRTHRLKGEAIRQIVDYSYAAEPIANPHTTLSLGSHARYWVVEQRTRGTTGSGTTTETSSRHVLLERVARYEESLAAELEETRRTADSRQGADFESTWVREMGWARNLAGSDLSEHFLASRNALTATERAKLRAEADITEHERLLRLGASFERLVARGIKRTGQVPKEVLRYLASVDADRPAAAPFRSENGQDTEDRYQAYWKRYLYYCVRAGRLGRDEATKKFRIRFNDAQWAELEEIIRRLDSSDNSDRENEGDGTSPASSTYVGSEELATPGYEAGEGEDAAEDPIDRVVMAFCVESLQQKVAVYLFHNPLLHFTAVLGISSSRKGYAWRPATEFTTQVAGLVWCARLILLEHIFESEKAGEDMGEEAIEHFRTQHRDWLADGSFSPFSAMIRIMTYGKGYRKKEGGTPRVMWEDNKEALRYLGQRIPLDDFRVMAASIVADAEELLDELMFREWLRGPGASFATHEKNSRLEPGFRKLLGPGTAQLWDDEVGNFRMSFRQALLVSTHVWGGQPGRGPEIITIRHCDTQDMLRNVFVFDGQVMLVTDRDKVTTEHIGVKLGVANYRHVAIELGRHIRVATTRLGTGVDIKGIVAIIHAEQRYGLVDFVQQTGRGGRRDGEVVEAVIVLADEAGPGQQKRQQEVEGRETEVERTNRLAMEQFVKGGECRRVWVGRFIDGVEGDNCSTTGAVECDWCEGQDGGDEESAEEESSDETTGKETGSDIDDKTAQAGNRLKGRQMEQQRRKEQLRGWLEEVEGESRCAKESLLRETAVEEVEGGLPEMEEWRDWIVRPREVLGERMTNGLAVLEAVVREIW